VNVDGMGGGRFTFGRQCAKHSSRSTESEKRWRDVLDEEQEGEMGSTVRIAVITPPFWERKRARATEWKSR
jgi:hypothetical protein